jgi:penicillin-binding protein 2A
MENGVAREHNRLNLALRASLLMSSGILSSCAVALPEPSPEAKPLGSITVCYADDLECKDPLSIDRQGNSTPVATIPNMCVPGENGMGTTVDESQQTEVDPDIIWALLSTEDRNFCETKGADLDAVLKAAFDTLTGNPRGGSNIAGQVADKFFIEDGPSNRVAREIWGTFRVSPTLDALYAKTDVMRIYLNMFYAGNDRYGIYEMSEMYFGNGPSNRTIDEAAFLVGAIKNPNLYSPKADPEEDKEALRLGTIRRNTVLQNQVEIGRLTQAYADELKAKPLIRLPYSPRDAVSDYYAEADNVNARAAVREIIDQVMDASGMTYEELMASNVRIHSTLLRSNQVALRDAIASEPLPADGRQFGALMIDDTGAITAYIPGVFAEEGPNINLLEAPVIGGSFDKIDFTVSFLKRGYTENSEMPNPQSVDWLNYDGNGRNFSVTETSNCPEVLCTLRVALEKSVNGAYVAEVKKVEESGDPIMADTIRDMEQLGMDPGPLVGPNAILGGQEMTPENRALGLLQKIARQGQLGELRLVNKFTLSSGEVREYIAPQFSQVIDPAIAAQLTSMTEGVIQRGTLAKSFSSIVGRTQMAGKTGTAHNNVNAITGFVFCDANGRNVTVLVDERFATSLSSMGPQTDGGGPAGRVAARAANPLIGQWCSIIDANAARIAREG